MISITDYILKPLEMEDLLTLYSHGINLNPDEGPPPLKVFFNFNQNERSTFWIHPDENLPIDIIGSILISNREKFAEFNKFKYKGF